MMSKLAGSLLIAGAYFVGGCGSQATPSSAMDPAAITSAVTSAEQACSTKPGDKCPPMCHFLCDDHYHSSWNWWNWWFHPRCPSICKRLCAAAVCGNGKVEQGETCDTAIHAGKPGACPTSCNDQNACTTDTLQNAGTCTAACTYSPITACVSGDGCCPSNCTNPPDSDCEAPPTPACGNGVVDSGETCDTAIPAGQAGACPTSCNDQNACTTDTLQNVGTCTAACTYVAITQCVSGDGCCPSTCNAAPGDPAFDSDCSAVCGNGLVEPGETCDTAIPAGQTGACPTSCDDGNVCTTDTLTGSACTAACTNMPITQCVDGDGCCPSTCSGNPSDSNFDSDCPPPVLCGNGVIDAGESCDIAIPAGQPGACPTTCDDGSACTTDTLTGAGTCQAACTNTPITQCISGDGCCLSTCNAAPGDPAFDSDCEPICGNGVVEPGEQCEPPKTATCDASCQEIVCADLNGTWITHINTTGTIVAPSPVNTLSATIDVIQRLVITEAGGTLTGNFEICSLSTTAASPIPFSVDYVPQVLATFVGSATVPDQCYAVGSTVNLASISFNTGWGGVIPSNNTCLAPPDPTSTTYPFWGNPNTAGLPASCSGAVDTDGDSVYGIPLPTHLFSGMLNIYALGGLTFNVATANTVLVDANTITGTTAFSTTGYIFGSNAGAVGNLNMTPSSAAVPVTLIKLPGNVSCADVLTHCAAGPLGTCMRRRLWYRWP